MEEQVLVLEEDFESLSLTAGAFPLEVKCMQAVGR